MILKKQTIEKMYKCNWGIHHLFWRFYLGRKYSPATKGIKHYIWTIEYVKKD